MKPFCVYFSFDFFYISERGKKIFGEKSFERFLKLILRAVPLMHLPLNIFLAENHPNYGVGLNKQRDRFIFRSGICAVFTMKSVFELRARWTPLNVNLPLQFLFILAKKKKKNKINNNHIKSSAPNGCKDLSNQKKNLLLCRLEEIQATTCGELKRKRYFCSMEEQKKRRTFSEIHCEISNLRIGLPFSRQILFAIASGGK